MLVDFAVVVAVTVPSGVSAGTEPMTARLAGPTADSTWTSDRGALEDGDDADLVEGERELGRVDAGRGHGAQDLVLEGRAVGEVVDALRRLGKANDPMPFWWSIRGNGHDICSRTPRGIKTPRYRSRCQYRGRLRPPVSAS